MNNKIYLILILFIINIFYVSSTVFEDNCSYNIQLNFTNSDNYNHEYESFLNTHWDRRIEIIGTDNIGTPSLSNTRLIQSDKEIPFNITSFGSDNITIETILNISSSDETDTYLFYSCNLPTADYSSCLNWDTCTPFINYYNDFDGSYDFSNEGWNLESLYYTSYDDDIPNAINGIVSIQNNDGMHTNILNINTSQNNNRYTLEYFASGIHPSTTFTGLLSVNDTIESNGRPYSYGFQFRIPAQSWVTIIKQQGDIGAGYSYFSRSYSPFINEDSWYIFNTHRLPSGKFQFRRNNSLLINDNIDMADLNYTMFRFIGLASSQNTDIDYILASLNMLENFVNSSSVSTGNEQGEADSFPSINLEYPTNTTRYNNYNGSLIFNASELVNCSYNNYWITNSTYNTSFNQANITEFNDGNHSFNISCMDSINQTTTIKAWFFIDTVTPIITLNHPENGKYVNSSFNINYFVNDTNLYYVNMTVNNDTGVIVYNDIVNPPIGDYFQNYYLNLFGATPDYYYIDGNYSIFIEAEDSHTNGSLRNLMYEMKDNTLRFHKGNFSFKFWMGYYYNEQINFITSNHIQNYDINLMAWKNDSVNEYQFSMDFLRPQQDIKFGFIIKDNPNLVLINKSIGHFIYKHWYIDFEHWVKNGFPINVKKKNGYYLIYTDTFYCDVNKGERCILHPSIGGLNYINQTTWFYVDTVNPQIIYNRSYVEHTEVYIRLNVTNDTYSYNFTFGLSCDGNMRNGSYLVTNNNIINEQELLISNITYYWNFTIYDKAENINNYCFNVTTLSILTEEDISNIINNLFEEEKRMLAITIIGLVIYLILLISSFYTKEGILMILTGVAGLFYSLYLFTSHEGISLVIAVFVIFNMILLIIGFTSKKE